MSKPFVRPLPGRSRHRAVPGLPRMRGRRRLLAGAAVFVLVLLALVSLFVRTRPRRTRRPADDTPRDPSLVLVTGYCNCESCCSWTRSWFGLGSPVYAYGPMKGRPKQVGVTASGTTARKGTVAADPKIWKIGTRLSIPGYGDGVVEDLGGAIRGRHIDVWFPTHEEARKWGRRWLRVTPR